MIIYESWQVDFQNAVTGTAGRTAYFETRDYALQWIITNAAVAGVCHLTKRVVNLDTWGVYGTSLDPLPTLGQVVTLPAGQNFTRTRFGNVQA